MICANCNQPIYVEYGHHRSCDGDVCSERCALARVNYISSFDPKLNSPVDWNYLNKEIMRPPKKYGLRVCESSYRLPTLVEDCEPQHKSPPTLMTILLVVFMLRVVFA